MPISETGAERLADLPPWRRHAASAAARVKHLFGVHTYYETLRPVVNNDGLVRYFRTGLECIVCDKEPGDG